MTGIPGRMGQPMSAGACERERACCGAYGRRRQGVQLRLLLSGTLVTARYNFLAIYQGTQARYVQVVLITEWGAWLWSGGGSQNRPLNFGYENIGKQKRNSPAHF